MSSAFKPGAGAAAFIATFILTWLFKGCRWLFTRHMAFRRATKEVRADLNSQAITAWHEKQAARREGLDRNSKLTWFGCLGGLALMFAILPRQVTAKIFAWAFLGEMAFILIALICFQFVASAFAVATKERIDRL